MTDETLSRLLAGELPEAEAAEARAAIDADPALAARWAAMQALPGQLAALRDEPPPPLPAPIPEAPALAGLSRKLAPWAAAIAALVFVGQRLSPEEQRVLVAGDEWVSGHVAVLAGDLPVVVEGRAKISVEPPAGVLREWEGNPSEIVTMDKSHLLAALAGAVVTVAVYEGQAAVDAPSGDVVVQAGETWASADKAPAPPPRLAPTRAPEAPDAPSAPTDADTLARRVQQLEQENAALRMAEAVQRGRVQSHEGTPQPWPADLPDGFRPDPLRAMLDEVLAEFDAADLLVEMDCNEYPCLVLLDSEDPDGQFADVRAIGEALAHRLGEAGLGIRASVTDDGSGPQRTAGVTLTPPGDAQDPDLESRIGHRMKSALESLMGEPDTEDVDVELP